MFVLLVSSLGLRADVSLRVLPEDLRPGDVFVLEVSIDRAAFTEFSFSMPGTPQLRLLNTEKGKVTYKEGRYVQTHRWVMQAVSSGELFLDALTVEERSGGVLKEYKAPPLRLNILPYEAPDASDAPLLNGVKEEVSDDDVSWVFVFALFVLAFFLFGGRLFRSEPKPARVSKIEAGLIADLGRGVLRPDDIERALCRHGGEWSPALREAAEDIVYGGKEDMSRLLGLLKGEGK